MRAKRFEDAESAYGRWVAQARALGDLAGEAQALMHLGHARHNRRNPETALAAYYQAAGIYRQLGDYRGEADAKRSITLVRNGAIAPSQSVQTHLDEGARASARGDSKAEIAAYEAGAKEALRIHDSHGWAASRMLAGHALMKMGSAAEAKDHYAAALLSYTRLMDRSGEIDAVIHLVRAIERTEGYEAAYKFFNQLSYDLISRADKTMLAYCHMHRGHFASEFGRFSHAVEDYRIALENYRILGDPVGEADAAGHLGKALVDDGRGEEARAHLERAEELYARIGDSAGITLSVERIAAHYLKAGAPQKAIDRYTAAIERAQMEDDSALLRDLHQNMGRLLSGEGRHEEAERHLVQALRFLGPAPPPSPQFASVLRDLGDAHAKAGEPEKATRRYRELFEVQRLLRSDAVRPPFVAEGTPSASPATAAVRGEGRDRALLIATDRYDEFPALANPSRDADALRRVLEARYGFEATVLHNPTRADVFAALEEVRKLPAHPRDQLLVYVAGHGLYDPVLRDGVIVLKDSKASDPESRTRLLTRELLHLVDTLPQRHVLVSLDVCFGGSIADALAWDRPSFRGGDDLADRDLLDRLLARRSRFVITSTEGEPAPDGAPGELSPFAAKWIEFLGGPQTLKTHAEMVAAFQRLKTRPYAGEFGSHEPGGGFAFVPKAPR